ncbi:hypothetical protein NAC44_05400 [Allorhizobium sp. BGMRC 0089]|uniref:hypothetical protein n=1 Tax=Allorhizobium sonneratiae TaxID=2934936 RepID=UPI002034323A|nr:hypothetical protein [Allorhizobium sonneratiae]MCM2291760.1 hypothetical protein [Allorhizobium sonneratiae]
MALKKLLILAGAVLIGGLVVTSAQAQTSKAAGITNWSVAPEAAPTNLPGVKSQDEIFRQKLASSYHCTTDVVPLPTRDGGYGVHYFDRGMPERIYRCTNGSGVTATSSSPPLGPVWLPGINPRDVGMGDNP